MSTKKSGAHKKLTSSGWSLMAPGRHERAVMKKKCGSKCFLGPVGESCFPICNKGTCKINDKGVYAAYVRAREYASPKMKKCTKRWPCHKKRSNSNRSNSNRSNSNRSNSNRSNSNRSNSNRSTKKHSIKKHSIKKHSIKKHSIYGHRHSKKLYGKIASKAKKLLIKHGYEENLD
jgi:hypothetical protein